MPCIPVVIHEIKDKMHFSTFRSRCCQSYGLLYTHQSPLLHLASFSISDHLYIYPSQVPVWSDPPLGPPYIVRCPISLPMIRL